FAQSWDIAGDLAGAALPGGGVGSGVYAVAVRAGVVGLAGAGELGGCREVDDSQGSAYCEVDVVEGLWCFRRFGEVDEVTVEPCGVAGDSLASGPGGGGVGADVFGPLPEACVECLGGS